MKLTIVIPAHNEEESLPKTLDGLRAGVKVPHDVIVVDDHSTDGTFDIVSGFATKYNNVRVIKNNTNSGFTSAIKKGFSEVRDGVVVLVMADACDDPETINIMYEKIVEGYDVICGSRYMTGGQKVGGRFVQTILSKWAGRSLFLLSKVPTHDSSNAFKMYRKEVLDSIEIEEAGFASSLEIIVKLYIKGYRITEVPTTWHDRVAGMSNFNVIKVIKNYIKWYFWAFSVKSKRGN